MKKITVLALLAAVLVPTARADVPAVPQPVQGVQTRGYPQLDWVRPWPGIITVEIARPYVIRGNRLISDFLVYRTTFSAAERNNWRSKRRLKPGRYIMYARFTSEPPVCRSGDLQPSVCEPEIEKTYTFRLRVV